jgi:chromosomal replication initiation ATPase DnaA
VTVQLNPTFVFETLVTSDFNQLAVAAGKKVVRSPGASYNPLFIYGSTSIGKTHLLMAMGNQALTGVVGSSVEYVTVGAFEESFRAAQAAGEINAFRNRFADVDLILFDDAQLVQGRREVQAELLAVIQQLRGRSNQVVLASNLQPSAMRDVDNKLLDAFTSGLVVDIALPDKGERRRVIEAKLEGRNATLSDDAIDVLSDPDIGDLREVFSQLQRLVAFQELSDGPLDARVAAEVVHGRFSAPFREGDGELSEGIGPDEFSHFFDDVATTLSSQIESWAEKLKSAIKVWDAEGFDTSMLEETARNPGSASFKEILEEYESSVEKLLKLREKTDELVAVEDLPDVFFNPAKVADAEVLVGELELFGSFDLPAPTQDWTFESFVGGESNEEAVSQAKSAIANPGNSHNPLIIHGPLGVGKSHLLHALANQCFEFGTKGVCCCSTHDLVREAEKIHGDAREVWRQRYRRISALFLDDFQLISGQVEAVAVSEVLRQAVDSGTQVVLTWGGAVDEMQNLEVGLRSFLESGLAVKLNSPDRDLKLDLIHTQFARQGIEPSRDILDYLADRHVASLREIQSQVKRVLDEASRSEAALTSAFARQVLEGATPARRRSSLGVRASGIMVSPGVGVRSPEKMIWNWPELSDRIIEEIP